MHRKIFVYAIGLLLLASFGCRKHASTQSALSSDKSDACTLITKEDIQTIQGSSLADTKSSESASGGLRMSQCYFATAEPNKSVSLTVARSGGPGQQSPRDFWNETFGRYKGAEKELEREGDKEKKESLHERRGGGEEEEAAPPRKIDGIGEEAYWSGTRVGGALYVLKGNVFVRVSVGGPDKEEAKIKKSTALAQKALGRL